MSRREGEGSIINLQGYTQGHPKANLLLQFLYRTYLKHCWQWPFYGATFYDGVLHMKETKLEVINAL